MRFVFKVILLTLIFSVKGLASVDNYPVFISEINEHYEPFASTAEVKDIKSQVHIGGAHEWFAVKAQTPNGCEVLVANIETLSYMSMNGEVSCDEVVEVTLTKTKEKSVYELNFLPTQKNIKVLGAE